MEPPSEERKAGPDETRPNFDELDDPADIVRTGRTRDEIYSTVLQLHEPATVSEIAERSGVGPDATREYLRWFDDMGVARKVSDNPAQYIVNREYLHWRRANRLSETYREVDLVTQLHDVLEEIDAYRQKYEADSPEGIVVTEAAADREESLEEVWQEISDWETAIKRRDTLELALQMRRQRESSRIDFTWSRGEVDDELQVDM